KFMTLSCRACPTWEDGGNETLRKPFQIDALKRCCTICAYAGGDRGDAAASRRRIEGDAERVISHETSGADFSGVPIHRAGKKTHRRPPLWLGEAFYGGAGHERAGVGLEQLLMATAATTMKEAQTVLDRRRRTNVQRAGSTRDHRQIIRGETRHAPR